MRGLGSDYLQRHSSSIKMDWITGAGEASPVVSMTIPSSCLKIERENSACSPFSPFGQFSPLPSASVEFKTHQGCEGVSPTKPGQGV